jgi:tRNA uridine 5-carbamoylmethylation protein Kti12
MKVAFIMGGVPGSGKSTAARAIAQSNTNGSGEFWTQDGVVYYGIRDLTDTKGDLILAAIHSTDEYFMKDGEYKFNPSKLGVYHNANYKAFRKSLLDEIPIVICDNTNTTRKEWGSYAREAEQQDYIVAHVTMPHPKPEVAAKRNSHGVPIDVIEKMISRWNPDRS